MKRIAAMLLALSLLSGISIIAYADSVTISVEVPSKHTVALENKGGGTILVNGKPIADVLELDRQEVARYQIVPDEGFVLDKLIYNGEDVTAQIKDNIFIAPPLIGDMTLEVTFKQLSDDKTSENPGGTKVDEDNNTPKTTNQETTNQETPSQNTTGQETTGSTAGLTGNNTENNTSKTSGKSVKTGDSAEHIIGYIVLVLASAMAVMMVIFAGKRKKDEQIATK